MRDPIVPNPVVKMRPHPAAQPSQPFMRKYPPPPPRPVNSRPISSNKIGRGTILSLRGRGSCTQTKVKNQPKVLSDFPHFLCEKQIL